MTGFLLLVYIARTKAMAAGMSARRVAALNFAAPLQPGKS